MITAKQVIPDRERFTVHEGSKNQRESVSKEQYDELLDRYEHLLGYASALQERVADLRKSDHARRRLESENTRLKHLVEMGEDYIELLEEALGELGMLSRE